MTDIPPSKPNLKVLEFKQREEAVEVLSKDELNAIKAMVDYLDTLKGLVQSGDIVEIAGVICYSDYFDYQTFIISRGNPNTYGTLGAIKRLSDEYSEFVRDVEDSFSDD